MLALVLAVVAGQGGAALAAGSGGLDLALGEPPAWTQDAGAAPSNLVATPGNCMVKLAWEAPASPPAGSPVLFYNIYRWEDDTDVVPTFAFQLTPENLEKTDFWVRNGHTYTYEVKAQYEAKVESLASPTAVAVPVASGLSVVLTLGSTAATINGAAVTLDTPAQIVGGATMVPLRFVATALGAEIKFDSGPQLITTTLGGRVVRLWIGKTQAEIDGQAVPLAYPPCMIGGRTMVPVRFIAEAFGAQVGYHPEDSSVTVVMADSDASMETATLLTVGEPFRATLNGPNDVDYYRMQTSPGKTYVAKTLDLADGCDTLLALVNSNGVLDYSDDASDDTLASEIQTYKYGDDAFIYIRVQSADPETASTAGNYSVVIEPRAVAPRQAVRPLLMGGQGLEGELLSPSDLEYYMFNVTRGQQYHVMVENLPISADDPTRPADVCVVIFDDSAQSAVTFDDNSMMTVSGDYYGAEAFFDCQVSGYAFALVYSRSGHPGRYRIAVDQAKTYYQSRGPSEATAAIPDHDAFRGYITGPGAEDWFSFTATAGTTYWVQTQDLEGYADTVMTLYGPGGTQELAHNDDAPGVGYGSRIEWTAPSSGTFYVQILPYTDPDPAAPPVLSNGSYVFCVTTTGPEYDNYDWDHATAVTVDGEPASGSVVLGDYDWFVVDCSTGFTYTAETLGLEEGCDTYMAVVDEDGNLLGENDDAANGPEGSLASSVTWTANATGKVYIRVHATPGGEEGQDGTGTYKLKVSTSTSGTGL